MKQSKTNYFNHYFESNWNSIKNTWKGIKSIITIKNFSADIPKSHSVDGATFSNPLTIVNIFSNYFSLISPTDKSEIENIISSLDSNKLVGSNSIPIKILKLIKNDISSQLSEISNIYFSSGVFSSILKTAKVIPVHKRDSKLDFSNYRQIYLLSDVLKILEKLMYNRIYKFFSDNNLIYSLQFGLRQKYSTVHALISLTESIRKNLG